MEGPAGRRRPRLVVRDAALEGDDVLGADAVAECTPVYESLPGWTESTVGVRAIDGLPRNARAYLDRIEQLTGAPLAMVSTGPDRDETILLRHPFH